VADEWTTELDWTELLCATEEDETWTEELETCAELLETWTELDEAWGVLLGAIDEELVMVRLLYVLNELIRQYASLKTSGFSATYLLQEAIPSRPSYI
jgi:hypothetical protein